jgi:hypothetical protein
MLGLVIKPLPGFFLTPSYNIITPKPGGAILLNPSIPIVYLFLRSRGLPAKLLVFIYVHLWFFSSLACKYFLGS